MSRTQILGGLFIIVVIVTGIWYWKSNKAGGPGFRACGRVDQQGAFAGPCVSQHFKGKNVAIVDDKSTYGKGLADLTRTAMNNAGLNEAMDEEITAGDKDYSALVSKLKSGN